MSWKNAAAEGDLLQGESVWVRIEGADIALVKIGTRVFGVSNLCTHEQAYLTDGFVDTDDSCIECPLHQARFDLATGKLLSGPHCESLQVFPVEVLDGAVFVDCG